MSSFDRCAAYINLTALAENYNLYKSKIDKKLIAVVKANAYGHGAVEVAKRLTDEGCQAFAVATVDEGIELRRVHIEGEIIVLGYIPKDSVGKISKYGLTPTVYDDNSLQNLSALRAVTPCYIKFDTGMNRLGFPPNADMRVFRRAKNLNVVGAFTHLAVADSLRAEDISYTDNQLSKFKLATDKLQAELGRSILKIGGASAWALRRGGDALDGARIGIGLYGINPSDDVYDLGVTPVMTVKSVVSSVKVVDSDSFVSYGRTCDTRGIIKIAVVAIGYADGYPRNGSNRGVMIIGGRQARIIGRVTMDQAVVDATDIPCEVGDEVTVIGEGVRVEDLARVADTIPYELVCRISARVPRIYL